jgi:hypothetical protein
MAAALHSRARILVGEKSRRRGPLSEGRNHEALAVGFYDLQNSIHPRIRPPLAECRGSNPENIFHSIKLNLKHLRNQQKKLYHLIKEGYRSIVVDDKDHFNNTTKDQVRQHFKEWVDKKRAHWSTFPILSVG